MIASAIAPTFRKEEGGCSIPPIGIMSSASTFNKGLDLKNFIQDL